MAMRSIADVVQAILPMFGGFEDAYDVESIAFDMVDFNGDAFTFKPEFDSNSDAFNQDLVNETMAMHER